MSACQLVHPYVCLSLTTSNSSHYYRSFNSKIALCQNVMMHDNCVSVIAAMLVMPVGLAAFVSLKIVMPVSQLLQVKKL